MATCARYITDGHSTRAVAFNGPARAYSAEEALNEILLGKSMDVAAWDKIYVVIYLKKYVFRLVKIMKTLQFSIN